MKILHLSSEKSWRGGEQQIAYLMDELINAHGAECHVVCRKGSAFETYCKEKGITNISASFSNSFDLLTSYKIAQYCRKHQIDIVHMHSGKSHGIGVLSLLMGNPAAFILSRRVDFPVKDNWFAKWKYNHKKIRRILCVSDKIKEIVGKALKDANKCITVHSGIDLRKFDGYDNTSFFRKQYDIGQDEIIIGNTSALAPHKDYFTFIDTAALLVEQNVKARF